MVGLSGMSKSLSALSLSQVKLLGELSPAAAPHRPRASVRCERAPFAFLALI